VQRQGQRQRQGIDSYDRGETEVRGKAVWCRGEAEIKAKRAKAPETNQYYHYRFASVQKNDKNQTL